jgi:carbon-monoxide dehydrogenase medium subunit
MAELESVPADLQGSSDYRKRVGAAMVARAWASAVTEAAHA